MSRAAATARRTGQSIERSMSGMSVRTSQALGGIRVAATGLGVALGVSALVNYGRAALDMAAGLSETSARIGVTVEQLQVLRLAATQNGASVEGMERAISILNRTLGQARANVPAAVQSFQALSRASGVALDPRKFAQAGDAIGPVIEAISRLRSSAEQMAIGSRLMGRGFSELLPLVQQGASGLERYRQEMVRTGMITQEQADKADQAMDALGRLATMIETRLAGALVDLIPNVEAVINAFAGLIDMVSGAIRIINEYTSLNPGDLALGGNAPAAWALRNFTSTDRHGSHRISIGGMSIGWGGHDITNPDGSIEHPDNSVTIPIRDAPAFRPPDGLDLSPHHSGGGARHRGGTDRSAERALQDEHDHDAAMRQLRIQELQALQGQTEDAVARQGLDEQIAALEREQWLKDRELDLALKHITRARFDELVAAKELVTQTELQGEAVAHNRQVAENERDLADARYDAAAAQLRSEDEMAQTAAERRRAELALLALTYRHQRAKLDAILNDRTVGSDQHAIDRALIERQALDENYRNDQRAAVHNTMGPLETYLNSLPNTAERVNEALQAIAVEGLGSITDALADAITGTKSLGAAFKNVAAQIISELLKIQIQRSIIGPLSNAISGLLGTTSGSSPFISSSGYMSFSGGYQGFAPRAAGGPVLPGRTYLIGEKGPELLHMGGAGHVIANDNIGGGGGDIHVHVNAQYTGNLATKEDALAVAGLIAPVAVRAIREAQRRRA